GVGRTDDDGDMRFAGHGLVLLDAWQGGAALRAERRDLKLGRRGLSNKPTAIGSRVRKTETARRQTLRASLLHKCPCDRVGGHRPAGPVPASATAQPLGG